jgi:hypothetical protein
VINSLACGVSESTLSLASSIQHPAPRSFFVVLIFAAGFFTHTTECIISHFSSVRQFFFHPITLTNETKQNKTQTSQQQKNSHHE